MNSDCRIPQLADWAISMEPYGFGESIGVRIEDAENMFAAISVTGTQLLGADAYELLSPEKAAFLECWEPSNIGRLWKRKLDPNTRTIDGMRDWIHRLPTRTGKVVVVPTLRANDYTWPLPKSRQKKMSTILKKHVADFAKISPVLLCSFVMGGLITLPLYALLVAVGWMGQDKEFTFKVIYLLAMLLSVYVLSYIYKSSTKTK